MSFGVSYKDVVRYKRGDKLTYKTIKGELVKVVAMGPGEPMEPGWTPVKVTSRTSDTYPLGHTFTASNAYLSER